MRSTYGTCSWHLDPIEQVVGFSLGSDSCAEHEVGTKGLARSFGYNCAAEAGVASRHITRLPDTFAAVDVTVDDEPCFLVTSNLPKAQFYIDNRQGELQFGGTFWVNPSNTTAAWDENHFAILSRGEDIAHLRELGAAFQRKDIMAGGLLKEMYAVRGLTYAIASRVPPPLLEAMQQELDDEVLRAAILEKSGIHAKLRKAGLHWYSLSTTIWADKSKTSIRVWLNPENQRIHDFGWFSLEELEQWAQGTGPIMKKSASR